MKLFIVLILVSTLFVVFSKQEYTKKDLERCLFKCHIRSEAFSSCYKRCIKPLRNLPMEEIMSEFLFDWFDPKEQPKEKPKEQPKPVEPKPEEPKKQIEIVKNDDLWKKYQKQMFEYYSTLSFGKKIHLMEKPIVADWDDFKNSEQLSKLGNEIPDFDSKLYVADPKKKPFYTAYYQFLSNIDDKSEIDEELIKNLESDLEKSKANLKKFMDEEYTPKDTDCQEKFEKMKNYISYTYQEFKNRMCSFGLLESKKQRFETEVRMIEHRINQAGRLTKAESALKLYQSAGGNFEFKEVMNSLSQFKEAINNGHTNGFSIDVSKSSSSSSREHETEEKNKIKTQPSEDKTPIIIVKEKTAKMNFTTSTSIFSMKIVVPGSYFVDIEPSETWYDKSVISVYAKGPFKDLNKANYFGKSGSMSLLKSRIHLVYKPKVIMTLNEKDALFCASLKQKLKLLD